MKPDRSCARRARRAGNATLEFALVAPLLLLLTAGALDYALLLRSAASLADAARVGAQFGSLNTGNSSNLSGMQTAAVNSIPGISGVTATAVQSCQCPGGTAVSCTGSCTGGKMLIYVKVTTQATIDTVFGYSQLPFTATVKGQASMRAQ